MPTVVLDANLLLLLIVGTANRSYIRRHRRLQQYNEADFDLLQQLIAPMSAIVVTPNILTETSNFAQQIAEPARALIAAAFRAVLDVLDERHVDSRQAAAETEFPRLWLTDTGILSEMDDTQILLTADHELYIAALNRGLIAENFNYLR